MKIVAVTLTLLTLSGCSTLGLQSDTISLPRDQTLIAYGEAKATFRLGSVIVAQGCQAKKIDEVICRIGADLRAEAQTLDALLTAALVDKRGTLSPQDLQRFILLGGQIAALAGYTNPTGLLNLGTLPK